MKAKIRSVRQMVCQGELGTYGNVSKILHPMHILLTFSRVIDADFLNWIISWRYCGYYSTLEEYFTNLGLYPHYFNLILWISYLWNQFYFQYQNPNAIKITESSITHFMYFTISNTVLSIHFFEGLGQSFSRYYVGKLG